MSCLKVIFDVDGTIQIPPPNQDDTFSFILNHGRIYDILKATNNSLKEYDQINNLCKAKGGHLAVPESQEKIQAIKSSILEHIRIFNYQSPRYLLGIITLLACQ